MEPKVGLHGSRVHILVEDRLTAAGFLTRRPEGMKPLKCSKDLPVVEAAVGQPCRVLTAVIVANRLRNRPAEFLWYTQCLPK